MTTPTAADETLTIDERSHWCFGCGPGNPQGLHLQFEIDAVTMTASANVLLTRLHEGPPGYLHGGVIATLMDEAMSKLNKPLQLLAMTRNLSVDYLRPAPLGMPLRLVARHLSLEGRKVWHGAELLGPDGTVLARARGLFLVVNASYLPAAKQES